MSTLKQRTGEKTLDGIEQRGLEYLLEVQKYMRNALRRLSLPYLIIDAREPVENIHQKILTYLGL
jgi:dTMP kinase